VRRIALALVLLAFVIVPFISPVSLASEGGTWTETKVEFGGYTREYVVYLPQSWKRGGQVVVFFPGFTLSYKDYRKSSGLIEASDKYGTALVIPDALPQDPKFGAWVLNPRVWDMGQIADRKVFVDDAAFVDQLIKDVLVQTGGDSSRVFLAGHSNGAYFAFHMVAKYPGRFAGLASFMGRFYKTAMPKSVPPIPTIVFNGIEDPILPIGGKSGKNPWDSVPAAQDCIEQWASLMGLVAEPSRQLIEAGGYQLSYRDALGRVMLLAVYIDNQGHWIPGHRPDVIQGIVTGPLNMSYDAVEKTWQMFMAISSQGLKQI